MKKVGLFLSANPYSGGVFQYCRTILSAMLALEKSQFSVVVAYGDPFWEHFLPENIVRFRIRQSGLVSSLLRLWITTNGSLRAWRRIAFLIDATVKTVVKQRCDLWVFPAQDFWPVQFSVPALAAVHDLMHRYESGFPEVSSYGRFAYREAYLSDICKRSLGILADSDAGKHHVHESYGTLLDRIFVLPYVASTYINKNGSGLKTSQKYALPRKYLFYPALFWKHKNHIGLIRAVAMVKREFPDIRVVLSGSKTKEYRKILAALRQLDLEESFVFLGHVPNEDLADLYIRARALIMPTFFGPTNIPPLEAFQLGCPVAVSGIYGVPQQVGDAALLFDPRSVEEIALCIRRLWSDDGLCQELSKKGSRLAALWQQPQFDRSFGEIITKVLSIPDPATFPNEEIAE